MNLQLDGKRALVTGSSSGIGEAIATTLAAEGATVVVHGRDEGRAQAVAERIRGAGGTAQVVTGTVATDEGAKAVADGALAALGGGIDILVNNAGEFHARGWADTPPAQWNELFNANVASTVRLIQALMPGMRQAGWGRIIQMSSVTAALPFAMWPDYCATKAALANLTVSLAKELAGTAVTVNAIAPGTIMSQGALPFFKDAFKAMGVETSGDDRDALERNVVGHLLDNPLKRPGQVQEVADLCAFIASPRSGFINGTVLHIDGGALTSVH